MANTITYGARPDLEPVGMSNGLTSVFFEVLAVSAFRLARTDREMFLARWMASHDQSSLGTGCVGFDIARIPWDGDCFAEDRTFLLKMVEHVLAGKVWSDLPSTPNKTNLTAAIRSFRLLIEEFVLGDVSQKQPPYVPGTLLASSTRCNMHSVFVHAGGCIICHSVGQ